MTVAPLLWATDLRKVYGQSVALAEAAIQVEAGEVRSLVGANGAGKSTLIKILTGAIHPTSGVIEVNGQKVEAGDPARMIKAGIACIYQHSNLVPALSVLDNIFLGRQPTSRFGILDRRRQRREAEVLIRKYQIDLDLDALVTTLPTVKQKEVEIAKALALDAKILLMDEPTAWLSHGEVTRLFETIRTLKASGVGIIYISHILDELYQICDTVTVLRDGQVVADCPISEIGRQELMRKLFGDRLATEAGSTEGHERHPGGNGIARLNCHNLTKRDVFDEVSFEVFAGEIFCITGLIGSKRTDLVRAIFGADSFDRGSLTLGGVPFAGKAPSDGIRRRLGFVPEDRHRDGLMLNLSIAENLAIAALDTVSSGPFLRGRRIADAAARHILNLGIRPTTPGTSVRMLSGGNQQKVLIGKWLQTSPEVLILDEPTVGVDVGAKSEIYGILRQLKQAGSAILAVSSDIEEVMMLSDRIMVMRNGRVQGIYNRDSVTRQEILAHVGGT